MCANNTTQGVTKSHGCHTCLKVCHPWHEKIIFLNFTASIVSLVRGTIEAYPKANFNTNITAKMMSVRLMSFVLKVQHFIAT